MCYSNDTVDLKQIGFVGDAMDELKLRLYVDADLAGDRRDSTRACGILLLLRALGEAESAVKHAAVQMILKTIASLAQALVSLWPQRRPPKSFAWSGVRVA